MSITLSIGRRRRRALAAATGATLLAGLGLGLAVPGASASEVCGGLDSGKIDVSGEQASVTVTADEGELISGYCVKAGSSENDGGPVYVDLDEPMKSVTISHPTKGSVSHYSYSVVSVETGTTTSSTTSSTTTSSTTPTDTGSTTPTDTGSTTPTDTGSTTPTDTGTMPTYDCPAGTIAVAKFEFEGGVYVAEFGGHLVTVEGDAEGGTFVTADGVVVAALLVKGSTVVLLDDDGNSSFSNAGLVNPGGQLADISNIVFCGSVTPTDTGSTTPTDTGSTTPTDTGSTTPTDTGTMPTYDCPEGTTVVAKFNLVGGVYVAEFGGELVTVDGDADGGTFVTADGVVVVALLIKGGTTVLLDDDGNLSFDNDGLVNAGGQIADISNIEFCGSVNTPTDTGSTTPTDTGSTTPTDTGSTTPTDTGSTTPTDTGSTTPTDTGSVLPTDTTTVTVSATGTTPAGGVTTTPAVRGAGFTAQPQRTGVLARTGIELWAAVAVAGLLLASGTGLVAATGRNKGAHRG